MRILTVSHNHSSFHPGGTEIVAEGLTVNFNAHEGHTARHLAGIDSFYRRSNSGTFLQALPGRPEVTLFRSQGFDVARLTQTRFDSLLFDLAWFLQDQNPDVVHIHHLIHFGVEFLALVRRVVPSAKIVFTLHDYYLICRNDGLMVKVNNGGLCAEANPDACSRCFPDQPSVVFQVRKLNILNHLEHVDMFVSPSEFLRMRFIEWGIPSHRIRVIPNGRPDPLVEPTGCKRARHDAARADRSEQGARRNRFGIFGNLRETKGSLIAAEAAAILVERGFTDFRLDFFGDSFFQPQEFVEQLEALVKRSKGCVRLNGYFSQSHLPRLIDGVDWIMVPSTWWENSPLAIQDAFLFNRPVIVSDIGGMAEAVRDGVDGLHVRTGDPVSWANAMQEAASDAESWNRMVSSIRKPTSIDEMATAYLDLFESL